MPTGTLEKLAVPGVAERTPGLTVAAVLAVPLPANASETGLLTALLVQWSCPLTVPAAVGEKLMITFTEWPGVMVRGNLNPITLNPEPLIYSAEKLIFAFPVLDI